jgi:hypothetical protein
VALDVAEVLGARHLADDRRMRPGRAVEKDQDRGADAERDADLDAEEERAGERDRHRGEIGMGIAPGAAEDREVDQRQDRDDDGGGNVAFGRTASMGVSSRVARQCRAP